jgi:hypothetical protein
MGKYRPPHSWFDLGLAGPRTRERYLRDNENYERAWQRERARSDFRSK